MPNVGEFREDPVALRLKGYSPAAIAPYGRVVAAGIAAIVDLEKAGYLSITP